MRKTDRFDEVITTLYCITNCELLHGHVFPHSVVTELLFSIRFVFAPCELHNMFLLLVVKGYDPFSFDKNSKEYIQVSNIIKIIDHADDKKNK